MSVFDKVKHIYKNRKIIEDDIKLYTKVIYNTEEKFMLLIEYSSFYSYDIIEFIAACNQSGVIVKLMDTEYQDTEEEKADSDEFTIKPEKILHQRYYMLLSGNNEDYSNLFFAISSLSNTILNAVIKDIYNNRKPDMYKEHIKNGMLDKELFEKDIKFDNFIEHYYADINYTTDDYATILSRLPKGFHECDVLHTISFITSDRNVFDPINYAYDLYTQNTDKSNEILKSILDYFNISIEKLIKYHDTPKYMLDDDITGDIEPFELDDAFKEKYEKFNAYDIQFNRYQDIDEEVESENADEKKEE